MEVRDAVEADASALAGLADAPTDVMRNLVHDRTVRVAERESPAAGPNADADDGGDEREVLGFVSFDARERTVHVTQLRGTDDACRQLLSEPVRFAAGEGMTVELLVEDGDDGVRSAAEAAGFSPDGPGPRFEGVETVRYRLDPDD